MTDESKLMVQVEERAAAIARAAEQSGAQAMPSPGERKLDPWFVLERLRRNRVGDADLFVTLFRNRYVYVPEWDRWLYWSGHHWDIDLLCRRALADVEQVCAAYQNAIAETAQDDKSPLFKTMRSRIDKLRTAAGGKSCSSAPRPFMIRPWWRPTNWTGSSTFWPLPPGWWTCAPANAAPANPSSTSSTPSRRSGPALIRLAPTSSSTCSRA